MQIDVNDLMYKVVPWVILIGIIMLIGTYIPFLGFFVVLGGLGAIVYILLKFVERQR